MVVEGEDGRCCCCHCRYVLAWKDRDVGAMWISLAAVRMDYDFALFVHCMFGMIGMMKRTH